MSHLTVNVLGEFQVLIDGIPISALQSDKVRALLAYLVVEADHSHRRETLIGLLWPDCPEEAARHNLRQAFFNLRTVLGDHTAKPPYLLINHDSIQFNCESDYSLDLAQFSACYRAWESRREKDDFVTLVAQLEGMVNLYRGAFMQQFSLGDSAEFEDWILVQREALQQRMMNVLIYMANEHEAREDFHSAHSYALRQLEMDPWREEAHCQVMRVLALDGQRSAALAQYENCRKVLADELGVEPSTETRSLFEQIRSGKFQAKQKPHSQHSCTPIYSIPASLTTFIGREQELATLGGMIVDPVCHCITLVGPGGIGKTRLAIQAAEQHRNDFAHGCAFIPLASVGTVDAIIPAIASGINFAFYGPMDPKVQLLNYLREKQMLLILDNAEHLLVEEPRQSTFTEVLIEILQQCTRIKLLVTSREALDLQGEWLFDVQGLSFPREAPMDGVDEYSAVALFIQRARRAYPGIELSAEDKAEVVRLCQLVEGMPLALELAATWARILSPAEIVREIEKNVDFLNAQMRDLPERHRSIRAVFDHSWNRISTEEKKVLSRLAVFRGGFLRQAAEQVAGASLSILSSLVTRSLLRRTATGRYDLHELVRQYVASRLAEDPDELYSAQEQHSLYYLGLLKEKGATLNTSQQKAALAELTNDLDNIRAAWDWLIAHQRFVPLYQVSATLWYFFELHNWFKEGEVTFGNTAEALRAYTESSVSEDTRERTAMYAMVAHCGSFKFRQGRSEEAYDTLVPCVAFLRTSSDPVAAVYSLAYLGVVCWERGRFQEAVESLHEGIRLSREYGERWYEALMNEFLGIVAHDQGEYTQARGYLHEALTIFRQLGDPSLMVHVLSYLGRTTQMLGEYREAEELLREGLALTRGSEYRFGTGLTLDALGQVAYAQGHYEEANSLFAESADLFREMGDAHRLSRTLNHQGMNALALNRDSDAQKAFLAALDLAYRGGLLPVILHALTGVAAVQSRQKASQETLELVLYILQHPATAQETKNLSTQLQRELEAKLSREDIEAAQQCAPRKSLDEFVRQFRVSL